MSQSQLNPRASTGYSIIELMVVLSIISVLAMIAMPAAEVQSQRQKERELKAALRDIRDALDQYKDAKLKGKLVTTESETLYPANIQELTKIAILKDDKGNQMQVRFLRVIPRDPFYPDGSVPNWQTWGYRSFDSEASNPAPGRDVYDVYSKSAIKGLNGVPLRDW